MRTCLLCSNISPRYPLSLPLPSLISFLPLHLPTCTSSPPSTLYILSLFPSHPFVHPSHVPCIHVIPSFFPHLSSPPSFLPSFILSFLSHLASVHPSFLHCPINLSFLPSVLPPSSFLLPPSFLPSSCPFYPSLHASIHPFPSCFLPSLLGMLFCVPAGGSGGGGGSRPGPEGPQPAALHPAGAEGRPPREERAQGQGLPAAGGARLLQEVGHRRSPEASG